MKVTKRNSKNEPLLIEKIHKVVEWACKNTEGVSVSEVVLNAKFQFFDNISTDTIHDLLIKSAKNLIPDNVNYDKVASNLTNMKLRKEVFGDIEPPKLLEIVKKNISLGIYDKELLEYFSEEEWEKLNSFIKHENDFKLTLASLELFKKMYLVKFRGKDKDIKEGTLFETPQIAYILVSAVAFHKEDKSVRMKLIKDFYEEISSHKVGLPTPIVAGVRTPLRNFASCCLIEVSDDLDSIQEGVRCVSEKASRRAGIGISLASIRSLGSSVRGGLISHTGVLPFAKLFASAMDSVSQGGIRKSSANIFHLGWHHDFEDLVILKNNKGTHETRVNTMDHSFLINGFMYNRLLEDGNITLFCPNEVPDLLDAFYRDQPLFEKLYIKYEKDISKKKKTLRAFDYFTILLQERFETGRIYIVNIDNVNNLGVHKQDKDVIRQSNLCVAPETKILTKEFGYKEISSLKDQEVHVWNGEEWSLTKVQKTSDRSKLIKVVFDDESFIECTEYHKFYVYDNANNLIETRAINLITGDKLEQFYLPNDEKKIEISVSHIADENRFDETYCFTEKKRSRGVFNGILTGNCVEITLVTEPVKRDGSGLIALCNLASLNWGAFQKPEDMEKSCETVVRFLDNLLDHQEYTLPQEELHKNLYRPLGIGINNLAYFLAKRGLKYDKNAIETVFNFAEAQYYYLMKANVKLAKERGACLKNPDLKENFIFENYSKEQLNEIGKFCKLEFKQDWKSLREEISKYGLRHSVLTAIMPSEKNSIVANSTNGIEPPRDLISIKDNNFVIVPEYNKLKEKYHLLWDQETPEWYLKIMAVLQMFNDQSISTNTSYHEKHFPKNGFPLKRLMKDLLLTHKLGLKTLYYNNTGIDKEKSSGENEFTSISENVSNKKEESCDSCTL